MHHFHLYLLLMLSLSLHWYGCKFSTQQIRFQDLLFRCQSTATAMIEIKSLGVSHGTVMMWAKNMGKLGLTHMGLVLPPLPALTHSTVTKTEI